MDFHSTARLQVWHSRSDNSEVIACQGWLDAETCDQLQVLIDEALADRVARLRLDLTGLHGNDEVGGACLENVVERCRALGIALEIVDQ
jgi:anti-anti-sigma regulatory factor